MKNGFSIFLFLDKIIHKIITDRSKHPKKNNIGCRLVPVQTATRAHQVIEMTKMGMDAGGWQQRPNASPRSLRQLRSSMFASSQRNFMKFIA